MEATHRMNEQRPTRQILYYNPKERNVGRLWKGWRDVLCRNRLLPKPCSEDGNEDEATSVGLGGKRCMPF